MVDLTSSEAGRNTFWATLNRVPRGSSHGQPLESLALPWALNPLTRDTISRLLISASWVSNVTFKLPQTPRSHPLFHSFALRLRTVHHLQSFLCNFCPFLRAFLPPPLRRQRYDFCVSTTLLLRRIASLYIEMLGSVYHLCITAFFRSSVLLRSLLFLSGFSRVGGISWGFAPFSDLASLC